MARIVAGIGTSHVPSIGVAYDQGRTQEPAWKPLFDAYEPVKAWLRDEIRSPISPSSSYNDHGSSFFFDKYPTFAIGAADLYPVGDRRLGPPAAARLSGRRGVLLAPHRSAGL